MWTAKLLWVALFVALVSVPVMAAPPIKGEHVIVTAPTARLMQGNNVVGTVRNGQRLEVLKVQGPWIWTAARVEDKTVKGWIWEGNLANADTGVALRPTRRRFSYEPADANPAPMRMPGGMGRSNRGSGTPKYLLPKSDPNRFR